MVYRLNAFATVTFNETAEGIIDQRERPDEASVRHLSPCVCVNGGTLVLVQHPSS